MGSEDGHRDVTRPDDVSGGCLCICIGLAHRPGLGSQPRRGLTQKRPWWGACGQSYQGDGSPPTDFGVAMTIVTNITTHRR